MKYLESDYRRYKKVDIFVKKLTPFLKRYKLYVDVISNYVEEHYYGLKKFKPYIINYDPNKDKKKFITSNQYICLKVEDEETLRKLLEKGGEYLQFQFRFCDGDVEVLSEEDAKLFEMGVEINEALFKDSRTIAVIKDKPDCLGFHISYRDEIGKDFEILLQDIANMKT